MDLTFRLPGPWGAGKGANLQPTEVDNNFWALAEAIVDLQSNPAQPVGIASISVSGTQMTITLTDGSTMGPFTLPVLTFRWRGEWVPLATYAELDVFTVFDTGIFMAVLDHTSGATFDPDIAVGGEPALQQLFGSTNASLSGLSDVELSDPVNNGDVLIWDDPDWVNVHLGTMGLQDDFNVHITGGAITGMPTPIDPGDVVNKAYVDALPGGVSVADATMMSNIAGIVGPALPNTLTDFLDYVLGAPARGALLYRGGPGWLALLPGAEGLFLQTHDSGADPSWEPGGSGVTSIDAGPGIDTGGAAITATGTVSLAEIGDDTLLANIAGVSAPPSATTLTLFLDSVLGAARGTILTRGVGGWAALAPGTSGQYLKTLGTGADAAWDSPIGAGTVTSVAAGAGITTGGAPITGTGSVSLAAIATNTVLANTSVSTAAPIATTATLLLDRAFGTTQGAVLYRSASAWVVLTPGTNGQILTTGGASANPSWANAPAGAAIATQRILSNISGSTAAAAGNTLTGILDNILGSSRGMIVYRGSGAWSALAAGTSGQFLRTAGTGGDPGWATVSGGSGDVVGPGSATDDNVASFDGTTGKLIQDSGTSIADLKTEAIQVAISDETTAITAGAAKLTFRMPWAFTLTAVRASLSTAGSTLTTVDINEGGTTILSTKLTLDASERTSTTAATAAVISDTALADDAEITVDIDGAGTGAKGLKVTLIGTRA